MKHIVFYGNCQASAIADKLKLTNYIKHKVECFSTDISKDDFVDLIKLCDVIITQHINDNYRNKDYLSTDFIINNVRKDCKIIIFDSCYFDFYYIDLKYLKINDNILHEPCDYHFHYMIKNYLNKKDVSFYINNFVNNSDLKSEDELNLLACNSLNELYNRYVFVCDKYKLFNNVVVITCHQFILDNYKNHLLFYTMNHPTKYLFNHICDQLIKLFLDNNIVINYESDPLSNNTRAIIYKCVQKCVSFDISNYIVNVCGKADLIKIVKLYYDVYNVKKIDDLDK